MVLADWNPDPDLVLVVAGAAARRQAERHGIYHCQRHRIIRPAKWIAFYAQGKIDLLAEIDGPPAEVVIAEMPDLRDLAQEMSVQGSNGDPRIACLLIRLLNLTPIGPIENDLATGGKRLAWVMSQRYTRYERLIRATRTSELQGGY